MGGNQSRGDLSNECRLPCFFLPTPMRPAASDPIGTPLPDTPVYVKRKREQVTKAVVGGIGSGGDSLLPPPRPPSQGPTAEIHQGAGAEQKLNAKYQLLEALGVGSTSTVHKCRCKLDNKFYACKVIDVRVIEEKFQGMLTQFQTEIEALRQLRHPSIIQLFDVYVTQDRIYIVMELMEGGELFDYVVQKGTLSEDEAAKIVRKVTAALVFMHDKNICHRDLKPENLLLKRKPLNGGDDIDVKIIDFGLSKAMEEPVARTFLGTRGYLAPEMLQRREYTRAVDTWALGVIVFVLLCGCLPFDDDSATVPSDDLVRVKFVLRFPRWAKNLSRSAKNLLSHLLDTDPKTRFTAEQAYEHPWVKGVTASKSLLASPGKMRQSPALAASLRNARKKAAANGTPPTPNHQKVASAHTRKNSL